MTVDANQFHTELKAHLERFRPTVGAPDVKHRGDGFRIVGDSEPEKHKGSVTITGIPLPGLTVKYQHPPEGSIDPVGMARETAKIIGAASGGTAGGAAVGAVIGKVVLGGALAKVGVASAGVGIGVPVLAPVALLGGATAAAAYAAYKVGKGKSDHERMEQLTEYMEWFRPTGGWPRIPIFVPPTASGLSALWQPESAHS